MRRMKSKTAASSLAIERTGTGGGVPTMSISPGLGNIHAGIVEL